MMKMVGWLCVVASLSMPAAAQSPDAEQDGRAGIDAVAAQLQRVQAALAAIDAEQQAVYRQFQMIDALRAGVLGELNRSTVMHQPALTPESYDELAAERAQREARLAAYAEELQRLYTRFGEIQAQRAPLIDTLRALAQTR